MPPLRNLHSHRPALDSNSNLNSNSPHSIARGRSVYSYSFSDSLFSIVRLIHYSIKWLRECLYAHYHISVRVWLWVWINCAAALFSLLYCTALYTVWWLFSWHSLQQHFAFTTPHHTDVMWCDVMTPLKTLMYTTPTLYTTVRFTTDSTHCTVQYWDVHY